MEILHKKNFADQPIRPPIVNIAAAWKGAYCETYKCALNDFAAQFIKFARPEQLLPLTFHFVTGNGQDVENIVAAESPYWPYPQIKPTR